MKFYIASSFKNIDTVRYVSEKLLRKGFIHNPMTGHKMKEI